MGVASIPFVNFLEILEPSTFEGSMLKVTLNWLLDRLTLTKERRP